MLKSFSGIVFVIVGISMHGLKIPGIARDTLLMIDCLMALLVLFGTRMLLTGVPDEEPTRRKTVGKDLDSLVPHVVVGGPKAVQQVMSLSKREQQSESAPDKAKTSKLRK